MAVNKQLAVSLVTTNKKTICHEKQADHNTDFHFFLANDILTL
jgi:hypothetical protein